MLVLVAAAIFPIVGMMSFAIDVSHWFDYSRNLQNRADAAALAAAGQFGGVCFTGGSAGTTTSGAQSAMGKWAQLYTGASAGESFVYSGTGGGTPTGRVPYSDLAVSASPTSTGSDGPGTGWNVTTNGYVNNTTGASPPVTSPLTLKAGIANINNFWLALNASDFAPNASGANTSFTMGPTSPTPPWPPSFCSSDPTYDQTDPQCRNQAHGQTTGPCAVAPMIDVKLTQKNVPLFIPLFSGLTPTIHGHARVTLEGEASTPAAPIAVGDTAFTPCVKVNLMDGSTNTPLTAQPIPLPNRTQAQPTDPVQWTSDPTSFTMPAAENVYVQPILSDCQNSIQTYDDSTNTGLLLINPKGASASGETLTGDVPPQISSDGVTVSGSCANGTQYLNEGGCNVTVNAGVAFGTGVDVKNNKANVGLIVHTWNNTTNSWNLSPTSGSTPLHKPGTAGCPATMWCGDPTIADTSGIAQFEITWSQTSGKIGAANCSSSPTPAACSGTFGIRAQSFGACDGCDQPDSSGPIVFARISQGANSDLDTFAPGPVSNVVFTLQLAGLNTAQYVSATNPPPTILRFSASSNHQTGLVDCGQGNGTNADAYAIYGGCGPSNSHFTPPLNPLYVNTRNTCGTPPGPPWPPTNHQDCVQTTPGQRRQGIVCPLVLRIVKGPFGTTCNNDPPTFTCPTNNWVPSQGHPPGNDPRAITMILTSQVDLAAGTGSPQFWLPIRQFATFYVVGWDSKLKPQCSDNIAFPIKGKKNQDNGAIWGFWINYTDFGIANGQPCPVSSSLPVNCVPALTR